VEINKSVAMGGDNQKVSPEAPRKRKSPCVKMAAKKQTAHYGLPQIMEDVVAI